MATTFPSFAAVEQNFEICTGEDWLDGWYFYGAGTVAVTPDPGNPSGAGAIGAVATDPSVLVRCYRVVIVTPLGTLPRFALTDLDGREIARGMVGAPFSAEGMTFRVSAGSTAFAVGNGFTLSVSPAPRDLSGFRIDGMLKPARKGAAAYGRGVGLRFGSVASDLLPSPNILNGGEAGILSLRVLQPDIQRLGPGLYDYDLFASAAGRRIRAAFGTVRVTPAVTDVPA